MDSLLTIYELTVLLTLLSIPDLDATLLSKTQSLAANIGQANKYNLKRASNALESK